AADGDMVGAWESLTQSIDCRRERAHHRIRERPRYDVRLYGQGRNSIPPPDDRVILIKFEPRKLAERNRAPAWQWNLQCRQRRQRDALLIGGARDDVDQLDVIAQLGNRGAGKDGIEQACQRLGAQAEEAGLVLMDANAYLPAGLDPVEVDMRRLRVRRDDLGEPESDLAHLCHVGTAHAILNRPTDGRAKLERIDATKHARKV